MKYIRTENGRIYKITGKHKDYYENQHYYEFQKITEGVSYLALVEKEKVIKQADTIEELCDTKVGRRKSNHKAYLGHMSGTFMFQEDSGWIGRLDSYEIIYGAIWTNKGLIYVAKMNEKGELELL